jgi:hypothetical protein
MRFNKKPITVLGGTLFTSAVVCWQTQLGLGLPSSQIVKNAENFTVLINSDYPGSGVIIAKQDKTYTVLTAEHVVKHPDFEYQIVTSDGQKYPVKYQAIKKFPGVDLAVVSFTSDRPYQTATLAQADEAGIGAVVYTAGFPDPGQAIENRIFQFTSGEVSGHNPNAKDGYSLIYTNITRTGMSGGPVLNEEGELVGIHGRAETDVLPGDGKNAPIQVKAGLNLGIPIKTFLALAPKVGLKLDFATKPTLTPQPASPPTQSPTQQTIPTVTSPAFQPSSTSPTGLPSRPKPIRPQGTGQSPVCAGSSC